MLIKEQKLMQQLIIKQFWLLWFFAFEVLFQFVAFHFYIPTLLFNIPLVLQQ
jgi:hypothetical protein